MTYEAINRDTREIIKLAETIAEFYPLLGREFARPEDLPPHADTETYFISVLYREKNILIREYVSECAACGEPMQGRHYQWGTCCSGTCSRAFYD